MAERCHRCNFPLRNRVEGHVIGAVGANTIVSFAVLFVFLVVAFAVTYPELPVLPLTVAGVITAIVFPLLFNPFSHTLWSAVDLAMTPVGPEDDVDPAYLPPSSIRDRAQLRRPDERDR